MERTYTNSLLRFWGSRLSKEYDSLPMDPSPLGDHRTLNGKRNTIFEEFEGEDDCSGIEYLTRIGNCDSYDQVSSLKIKLKQTEEEKSMYEEKYKE